ncbi:MAG: YGL010W-like membrane protein [Sphingobacteriales bacterium]|jgi:uncharacterized membrane protein YGL010W
MKSAQQWFSEYAVSHQNTTNEYIHWICVPAIFWSILGLFSLWEIPFLTFETSIPLFNSGLVFLSAFGLLFYATLCLRVFLGMFLYLSINVYLISCWNGTFANPLYHYILIFVLAWIGQFIGHKIEGKKPSFLKDLQFLMIGPAWVLNQWFSRKK